MGQCWRSPMAMPATSPRARRSRRVAVPESTIGGETTCIVCMARPKSHIAVPCGHLCVCGVCAERMQDCPYCTAAEPSSSGCTRAWSDLEHTVFDMTIVSLLTGL